MTDFANLVLKVDSSQVREGVAELDKLVPAGQRVEAAAGRMVAAQDRVTASAGAQRAGMQQLSFQIGDVAQQFALGTNPMIIFAQQGGQVVQALNMMKGGATGLIGFLAGPWGAVIMGAATVAGMFASKLWETKDAADGAAAGYRNAAAEARNLIGAQNAMALNQKRMDLNKLTEEQFRLESATRNRPYARDPNANFWEDGYRLGGAKRRLTAIAQEKMELQNLIKIAEQENAAIEKKARATETATGATRSARTATAAYSQAMRQAERDAEALAKSLDDLATSTMNGAFKVMEEARKTWASTDADELRTVQAEMAKAQDSRINAARAETDAQAALNDQLRDLIGNLDRLGGMGSVLGDIGAAYLGLKSGDFRGVRGPAGMLLEQFSNIQWAKVDQKTGERTIYKMGEEFSKVLDKVFGENGSFLKLLQGAGMGAATGQLIFGGNNKGAQIGGALGGAAGFAFGGPAGAMIGSLIGSGIGAGIGKLFDGKKPSIPGIIVGGLLGGIPGAILGGLIFGKTKWGTSSLSGSGSRTGGNDNKSSSNASTAGDAVSSLLDNLAAQLGGSVGDYAVSIGQYKNKWRVSTTGRTGKLETKYRDVRDFGKEGAEAAVRFALMDAISDGAIAGIRESTKRILLAGKDLDTQLKKALKFQGVFEELKASTDPLGAALDKLNKQFGELRSIFAEAGASAEEYAQLEQLLAIKRKEAQDDARAALVDKVRDPIEMQIRILELLGKEEDALAASRLLEMAGLKATLQPLQNLIYQLEDARKVIDTFEPLAEDLRQYRKELLGGQGEQSFGYIAAQFRTIAQAAANGDATALGQLRGAAGDYLGMALNNAGSDLEYRRALGTVLASVDKGIFAAETQVDYAQAQIDAVKENGAIMAQLRADLNTLQAQIVENTGTVARMWQRFEVNGLPVITNPAEPIQVEVINP